MRYIYASFVVMLFTLCSAAPTQAEPTSLPNGQPTTTANITAYMNSPAGQNLSVREGARMRDSMNFDDCFEDHYGICAGMGPCKFKLKLPLGSISFKVPSVGIEFTYWEPNALVETVCSQGNSYYESEMNMSSRIVGRQNLLGDKATIAGLPAEKCIETIRTGGGTEGAGATPRYFNEAHVWGIGALSRYESTANPFEATVTFICGYMGKLGGLFDQFGDDSDMDAKTIATGGNDVFIKMAETVQKIEEGIESSQVGQWMKDAYDTYTGIAEGFEGLTGLDLTKTLKVGAAIGGIAMAKMEQNSQKEVRAKKLCEQQNTLEKTIDNSVSIKDVAEAGMQVTRRIGRRDRTVNIPFDSGTYTYEYDDGGACPIGLQTGHTLEYVNDKAGRGVREVPFRTEIACNDDVPWRNSCYASGSTATRISQVQKGGLYPACKGYSSQEVSVKHITTDMIQGYTGDYIDFGYSAETLRPINDLTPRIGNSSPTPYYFNDITEALNVISPVTGGQDSVTCRNVSTSIPDPFGDFNITRTTEQCTAQPDSIYIESYDHVKQLNETTTEQSLNAVDEIQAQAESTLQAVTERIEDLGGSCDSSGEPVGEWGDALVEAAVIVGTAEGMQAGIEYMQESETYQQLRDSASEYVDDVTNAISEEVDAFTSEISSYFSDATEEVANEAVETVQESVGDMASTNVSEFMSSSLDESMPDLTGADLEGSVDSEGGLSSEEAMDYLNTAMDVYNIATYDGGMKQTAIGMATSLDPTGLWPAFLSEQSPVSWRGKDVPMASQLRALLGTVGHPLCSLESVLGDFGFAGGMLGDVSNFLSCVGTWGPVEPKTGFVEHRDSLVARALAGYRGYKLAVTFRSIMDHNAEASGSPMKINMDFPHQTGCFIPGTADLRWESEGGLNPLETIPNMIESLQDFIPPFDAAGNKTRETEQLETKDEGAVFTYWKKSKCCLYMAEYYGIWRQCFIVDREY